MGAGACVSEARAAGTWVELVLPVYASFAHLAAQAVLSRGRFEGSGGSAAQLATDSDEFFYDQTPRPVPRQEVAVVCSPPRRPPSLARVRVRVLSSFR